MAEIEQSNPLLADAYMETLANRLTASRIISRSKREMLKVERQLNRARTVRTAESTALQKDLTEDRERLDHVRQQASEHLAKAKTRLQVIEATASRKLSQGETDMMMQRLGSAQDQLPLVLEMAQLEQQALREATDEVCYRHSSVDHASPRKATRYNNSSHGFFVGVAFRGHPKVTRDLRRMGG